MIQYLVGVEELKGILSLCEENIYIMYWEFLQKIYMSIFEFAVHLHFYSHFSQISHTSWTPEKDTYLHFM